jgi:predicted transcriptional regulator
MKDISRAVRLDGETDRLLTLLARRFENNRSFALRWAIRQVAKTEAAPPAPLAEKEDIKA